MEKLVTMHRAVANARGLDVDVAHHLEGLLIEAGFENVQSEDRSAKVGRWGGEKAMAMKSTVSGVFRGVKTPVLNAGGFGVVSTEEEYDALTDGSDSSSQSSAAGNATPAPTPIAHTARVYQEYPGSQYELPTDAPERDRLALQYQILKELFANRVVYAPVELQNGDRVLDAGTGPGLWVADLAAASAGTVELELVGVDIERRLFPDPAPPNARFLVHSILDLPQEWSDTFTLVNQRFLIIALTREEWVRALKELYRVVKPGGWVQFLEPIVWGLREEQLQMGDDVYERRPCMEKVVAMYRAVARLRGLDVDVGYRLESMLAEAGFVEVRSECQSAKVGRWGGDKGTAMKAMKDILAGVFRGIKTPVLNAGGFGIVKTEEEYDTLTDGLEREWDEVEGLQEEFRVFWARKM
ncbi:S-adenosyl-L-methionine-dependent methyltransferase [Mycena kentingensis (nom. inval.)]|nr:S-adenosyl-L-methionine-dependent methyltransferase [Mycena kentingensis (nom. inval.)]